MPDYRIPELPELAAIPAVADLIPLADMSEDSGNGVTKHIRVDRLIPGGGSPGQVLEKKSSDDLDAQWKSRPEPQYCVMSWRTPFGSGPPNSTANVIYPILFLINPDEINTIIGLTTPTAGIIQFPVGVFLLQTFFPYGRAHGGVVYEYTRLILTSEPSGEGIYGGAQVRGWGEYNAHDKGAVTLNRILSVTVPDSQYAIKFLSDVNCWFGGDKDLSAYIPTGNNAAELFIQKLS